MTAGAFLTFTCYAALRCFRPLFAVLTVFLLSEPARAEVIESVGAPGMCIENTVPDQYGSPVSLKLTSCTGAFHQQFYVPQKTNVNPVPIGTIKQLGRCIEAGQNGGPARMMDCRNSDTHVWLFPQNGTVLNKARLCLDAERGGTATGTRIIGYQCTNGANQKWRIRKMNEVAAKSYRQILLRPRHADSKCLDVTRTGELIIWRCHGGANQRFDFTIGERTLLKVQGACVGSTGVSGIPLRTQNCGNNLNTYWRTTEQGGFQNLNTKLCIDIERGRSGEGARVIQYTCTGQSNQRFKATEN